MTLGVTAFAAGLARGADGLVLVGSVAIVGALVSVERQPRIRD